eukprot:gene7360-20078_t
MKVSTVVLAPLLLAGVANGLKVFGAGPGRTGTDSMKQALLDLGFGPTYHMKEILLQEQGIDTSGHIQFWEDYALGKPVDVKKTLVEFNSGVDYPMSLFTEKLMFDYPDAKIILTVRSSGSKWWASINTTICNFQDSPHWYMQILHMLPIPPFSKFKQQGMGYGKDITWASLCQDEATAVKVYDAWNAKVIAMVPPERLLVFQTGKHGYKELAEFLNVPVPDEPYPNVNSKSEFAMLIFAMKSAAVVFIWIWVSPFLFIGYCLCCRKEFGVEEEASAMMGKKKYTVEEMRKIMADTKSKVPKKTN